MADQQPPQQPEKKKRPKRHFVALDPELARMVGAIAAACDTTASDWVNNRLRPIALAEFPRAMEKLGYEVKAKK